MTVRKIIAIRCRSPPAKPVERMGTAVVWPRLFELAAADRPVGVSELMPYWLFPGLAKTERCVPAMPLSREIPHLRKLREALAVYRRAFGHSRQEDAAGVFS